MLQICNTMHKIANLVLQVRTGKRFYEEKKKTADSKSLFQRGGRASLREWHSFILNCFNYCVKLSFYLICHAQRGLPTARGKGVPIHFRFR
jgi:hypothetical protein